MEKEKVFDLACDCASMALNHVRESKEKYFSGQKVMRAFAIGASIFVVGKEIYDLVKQAKEEKEK